MKAWKDYCRIRKEELRTLVKNIVAAVGENPIFFYEFIASQMSVKEQLIRLRDEEGKL